MENFETKIFCLCYFMQRNSSFDTRYKFSAKELDSESGYNYFGARYYDSELINWLSVDPMADERSWVSPYSYVQNSPVNRVDPSGALDDEWEVNVETGEKTWKSNKGGDETQHVEFKYKDQSAEASFNTTKEEAKEFRSIMENEDDSWNLVGDGVYAAASFAAVAGGIAGSVGNFTLYSNKNESFNFSDVGPNFGYDLGASVGVIAIFGDKSLKGKDIAGYSFGVDFGAYAGEIGFTTSATSRGMPTFEYGILSIGATLSVPGGGVSPGGYTKVSKGNKPTNYWDRPNAACFAAGTKIHIRNKYKEIQDIMVGDTVCSYNFNNDCIEFSAVTKKYSQKSDSIFMLNVGDSELYVTGYHPFYVENKGWVNVSDLDIGDKLFLSNKNSCKLKYKVKKIWNKNVYNIEVENLNNYFVSKKKILVHNK